MVKMIVPPRAAVDAQGAGAPGSLPAAKKKFARDGEVLRVPLMMADAETRATMQELFGANGMPTNEGETMTDNTNPGDRAKALYDTWLKVQRREVEPTSAAARTAIAAADGRAMTDAERFADSVAGVVSLGDVAARDEAWRKMGADLSRAWQGKL